LSLSLPLRASPNSMMTKPEF